MNASKFILLAGLFAIITAEFIPAQDTPTPTATATVERDPVKSFKELVAGFPKRSIGKSGKTVYDIMDVTFDVKNTDSLIHPIMGIINFTEVKKDSRFKHSRFKPPDETTYDTQMEFHWQGDHLYHLAVPARHTAHVLRRYRQARPLSALFIWFRRFHRASSICTILRVRPAGLSFQ